MTGRNQRLVASRLTTPVAMVASVLLQQMASAVMVVTLVETMTALAISMYFLTSYISSIANDDTAATILDIWHEIVQIGHQ